MKHLTAALVCAFALSTSGCAVLVEAALDTALETDEEGEVCRDERRLREGRPMHHHQSPEHLCLHKQDLRDRDRDC